MFLDKPLKGAKLLQAIMRTNRPYPEKGKDRGVIVDYWGVFDRLQAAFAVWAAAIIVPSLGSAIKPIIRPPHKQHRLNNRPRVDLATT